MPRKSGAIGRRKGLELLYRRQKGRCHYCLRVCVMPPIGKRDGEVIPDNEFTRDHRLARCLGGVTEPDNIVGACRACNQAKSTVESRALAALRTKTGEGHDASL